MPLMKLGMLLLVSLPTQGHFIEPPTSLHSLEVRLPFFERSDALRGLIAFFVSFSAHLFVTLHKREYVTKHKV